MSIDTHAQVDPEISRFLPVGSTSLPRLTALLDRFVPEAMLEEPGEDAVRARTGVGAAFLAAGVFAALAMIRGASGLWLIMAVNVAQALAMVAFPIVLRRTGRLRMLVNVAVLVIFVASTGVALWVLGPGLNLSTLALAMLPLVAVLLGGLSTGGWWLLLCCGASVAVAGLAPGMAPEPPAQGSFATDHAVLIVVAVLLYAVGGLYERRNSMALEQIAELDHRRLLAERGRFQALADAKMAEAERLAALGEIAAMAAHEINNPLSYLTHNLEYVERFLDDAPLEARDAMGDARDGAARIARIVQDLQQHGRPEAEDEAVAHVRRAIEIALKTVEGHTRPRARVTTRIADVPRVAAPQGRLVQVLLNLLINAAQAIPEGRAEQNEISVRAFEEDDQVIIEIADTGPGVPTDLLGRVKEVFFTTKGGRGSGLGLALCERILKRFGATLSLRNAESGAIARVALQPARDTRPSVPLRVDPSSGRHPTATRRVLIVDDEVLVARAIKRQLRGHEVTLAKSGREAMELLEGQSFDLVLCDVMMPDLTGMDVHEAVRTRDPKTADAIVFMTGGTFTERAREFRERVPNSFLTKPVDVRQLRELLDPPT